MTYNSFFKPKIFHIFEKMQYFLLIICQKFAFRLVGGIGYLNLLIQRSCHCLKCSRQYADFILTLNIHLLGEIADFIFLGYSRHVL